MEPRSDLEQMIGAPVEQGKLILIVRRPETDQRELLERGMLSLTDGLVGDIWSARPSPSVSGGGPNPDAQVTIMSARAAAIVTAGDDHEQWAQAGDQLYVDLDLAATNLPAGSQLEIGQALLEVTAEPHLGCGKFAKRFGVDALKLVNSEQGRAMRLRGVNARVVRPGEIEVGDEVRRILPC